MHSYIVREKPSGLFVRHGKNSYTKDINKARVYKRVCDIKNSLRSNSMFNYDYEIIKCNLVPELTQKYYTVKLIRSYSMAIKEDGTHWKPKVFDSIEKARQYISQSATECNLHKDYFVIEDAQKVDFDKQEGSKAQRPNWQNYFLGMAVVVSKRSHDIHTQHGCVIADTETHKILATGYNGFPRGMKDDILPTSRPDKYDWMVHSEVNACNNMISPATHASVAFVTGEPCTPCLLHLWQNGIATVIHRKAYGSVLVDERMRKNRQILLDQTGMRVYAVEADLTWLSSVVSPEQRCI